MSRGDARDGVKAAPWGTMEDMRGEKGNKKTNSPVPFLCVSRT